MAEPRIVARARKLHDELTRLGIPVRTIRGAGTTCEIVFASEATAQQRADARALRDSWDWSATNTVDEDLLFAPVPAKTFAAVVKMCRFLAQQVVALGGSAPPASWWRDTLGKADTRIDAVINGRTPNGDEK